MLMTAASAASNLFFNKPFEGDYEVTKHFIAVAVFCFLPYCQLTGANVTVDIFTENVSERAKAAMVAFSSLFAIAFSIIMLRQMSLRLRLLHAISGDDGDPAYPAVDGIPAGAVFVGAALHRRRHHPDPGLARHARAVGVPLGGREGKRWRQPFSSASPD